MCRGHWYLVPKQIRDRVWATWRSGREAASAEHQEAVRLAITACQVAAQPRPVLGSVSRTDWQTQRASDRTVTVQPVSSASISR